MLTAPVLQAPQGDGDRAAPLLLRLERVAEALDCSRTTLNRLISAGALRAVKVNGATRVRVEDLRIFVDHLPRRAPHG